MVDDRTLARVQRVVVVSVVALAPALFLRPALDDFNLVKALVVVAGAIVLGALSVLRVAASGRLVAPLGPAASAVGTFVLGLLLATLSSGVVAASLIGVRGRYTGLLLYLALALYFVVVLRLGKPAVRPIVFAILGAGTVVVLYGLMQWVGVDPFNWEDTYGEAVFSTLGNPNFAAGFLGIVTPLAVWVALRQRNAPALRAAGALLALLAVLVAWSTRSQQGLAAAAVGSAVTLFAWFRTRSGTTRRVGAPATAGVAGLGLVAGVAGLAGAGPLAGLLAQNSLTLRSYYWQAALGMAADHPVLGVGLDRYGGFYRAYRPLEAAITLGADSQNDAAHNVVLNMFANGGVVLGLAYVAVLLTVTWSLVTGLRRLQGDALLLLGGLGGAWTAYVAQALVSIDVPALALTGWVLGATIVVVGSGTREKVWRLPWAPAPMNRRQRRAARSGRRAAPSTRAEWVAAASAGAVTLVGCWALSLPLRADVAAARTDEHTAVGDLQSALQEARRATALAGWESTYWFELGRVLATSGQVEESLQAFETAAERDPRDLAAVLTSARAAAELDREQRAARWYDRALELEPQAPAVREEVEDFRDEIQA